MKIELGVLGRQFELHKDEYEQAVIRTLNSGWYILGNELLSFEEEYKKYTGSAFCVGLNSGLDALILAVRALGIGAGDEVIVPANTYIASVLGITENGATPIFVEPDTFYNIDAEKIENAITKKTKAILVVHLYGQAANMEQIKKITKKHNIFLIEDCAQSHGAHFNDTMTGRFGDIGCFSFFPTKNLGAFGDAGAIITDQKDLYETVKMLRNYGSKKKYHNEIEGVNSRLDEIQASILRVKLSHLTELNLERTQIADQYLQRIHNPLIELPKTHEKAEHVWHQFVIRTTNRDKLQAYLEENQIKTLIHYPVPPHLSVCYQRLGYKKGDFPRTEQYANEILSLPIYNTMTKEETDYVIQMINQYKG